MDALRVRRQEDDRAPRRAAREINAGRREHRSFDAELATIHTTAQTTAILEAGRRSLDAGGKRVRFAYSEGDASLVPVSMEVEE